jgi:adenylosuccinate synthase
MPGWTEDVTGARNFDDLPDNARRYIDRIETLVEVQAAFISVGPGRDETIMRTDLFATN